MALKITIHSAKGLEYVNHISKMKVCVAVSLVDHHSTISKQITPVDKKGNRNPVWNYPITFNLSNVGALQQNDVAVVFEIYSTHSVRMDKLIGEVDVPLSDLIGGSAVDRNEARMLNYEVKKSGKPTGVLNLSCKFEVEPAERFDLGSSTAHGPNLYQEQPPKWDQQPAVPAMPSGYGYQPPRRQGQGNRFGHGHGGLGVGGIRWNVDVTDLMSYADDGVDDEGNNDF